MSASNQFDDDRALPLRRLSYLLQGGAGLIALLILGIGWLLANVMADRASDLDQAAEQAVALRSRSRQIRNQFKVLTTKVKAAQEDVEQAQARLGVGPQESRFIAQLTDLAEQYGLEVAEIRPGSTSLHASFGILELQLSGTGSYDGLCSFLAAMDKLPRICHVAGMNVGVMDAEAESLRIDLKMQLLFSLPTAEPASRTEKQA